MTVKHIESQEHFYQLIKDTKITVCKWTATWCGPCQTIKPQYKKMAELIPQFVFIEVDVDEYDQLSAEYQVKAMPSFSIFFSGREADRVVGADIVGVTDALNKFTKKLRTAQAALKAQEE